MFVISIFRFVLGVIFLVTGISKIPIFDAFAYSITELISIEGNLLTAAAVGSVAFEIIVGLALFFNKWTRLSSALLSLMIIAFIVMLSSALFRYESYICTCFGVLGLKLPVVEQIIVDMVLLLMAVMVFFYNRTESKMHQNIQPYAVKTILTAVVICLVWGGLIVTQPRLIFGEKPELSVNTQMIFDELPRRDSFNPHLVFMVDMGDFLCPDCVSDLVGMAERITEKGERFHDNVYILVNVVDFMERDEQRYRIDEWRAENRFRLQMKIDENRLFSRAGFDKSTVLFFTGLGTVVDSETFPMGSRRRNEITDKFLTAFK